MTAQEPGSTPDETDIHYQTVSQRVPRWLTEAPASQRQALRAGLPAPLPWLAAASARLPEVVQAWRDEYQRHQRYATALAGILEQLPAVEAFAEPLLREALNTRLGLDLDVRRVHLFNAARARLAESRLEQGDPAVRAFEVVKAATQSLLTAALQNFEAFEAEAHGMDDGRRVAMIFHSDSGQALDPRREVELRAQDFAALCRELDLGGQYQRLIDGLFDPPPQAQESPAAAAANRQAWFILYEQSRLRLELHLARLRGGIAQDLYEDLLEQSRNGRAGARLERSLLTLWEVELNGIVLFSRPEAVAGERRVVVYMPGEASQPLQAFDSLQAFHASMRQRLKEATWRTWFMRFVPARERAPLLRRIQHTLFPKVWNPGGWYEERFDEKAVLRLELQTFGVPLFNALLQRRRTVLKDDGLFHAVPTAVQDHKSAEDKIAYYLGVAFNVGNLAAFVVPGLGEVMLAVNAALLGYDVYEGFDSLAQDERDAAWGYFLDVGENLALIAALGSLGAAAQRFAGDLPLAVRGMRPVKLADGSVRLWKPDLAPFAYDIRLPKGLRPGANGLYAHEGRQWLKLDGQFYSVRTLLGEAPGYCLEHPTRPGAYEPALSHDGEGGWLHELDTPQHWRGLELFERLGHSQANLTADLAQRALRISGVSESQLRQTLVQRRRPPALLSDTLRRLLLAEDALARGAFATAYRAAQPELPPCGRLLARHFTLPGGLVEEIVAAATAEERAQMTGSARVPLRLAEEARLYQQQVRMARACEGLYLDLEANPDSACLLLHQLGQLPGWPTSLRVALYDGRLGGRLLASIGPVAEAEVALHWRGQLPGAFCTELFAALADTTRTRLGLSDAASLRERLRAQALPPRQRLRQWLGLQAQKPAFRSPMRLADGRIGHPLSGRGGNPFLSEDELLDKLRLLELDSIHAEDALQVLDGSGLDRVTINARLDGLLDEMRQLREHLEHWQADVASESLSESRQRSREHVEQALWRYWRSSILADYGRPPARLELWQVQLQDLPAALPEFFRERVRSVLLNDVMLQDAAGGESFIDQPGVRAFARQFPNVSALDIRAGQWGPGLTTMIVQAWPRLASLGLHVPEVVLEGRDLRALAGLPRLRWLDLAGMRVGELPDSVLDGMTLDFLGLNWLDLSIWPQWLNEAALGRIGELSLQNNRLSELPASLLDSTDVPARRVRVALSGNRFTLLALFDLRVAELFRQRFSFDLEPSLMLEESLQAWITERRQFHRSLGDWIDAGGPTPEQQAYRLRIARTLLDCWRESLNPESTPWLSLTEVNLDDVPEILPGTLIERVCRLSLERFSGNAASLERFVRRFPRLSELALCDSQPALGTLPGFLDDYRALNELALVGLGLTIDQAAMEAFARLPALNVLVVNGNRLGDISDVSMFGQHFFAHLGLARMNIGTWPAWLDEMVPGGIEYLDLSGNRLVTLPERLLRNRRTLDGVTEISLRDNPLPYDILARAYTSQYFNRPFSFDLDLPEEIANLGADAHSSDSDSEMDADDVDDLPLANGDPLALWQTGQAQADAVNRELWARLQHQGDSEALLGLVTRLRYSADYRSLITRAELVQRVWSLLGAAGEDGELRLILNAMAEEPLRQLQSNETCPDGIRLEFNQMEFKVHMRQALREITEDNRGPALFRLMRGAFRAQALDRIARDNAKGRDEAEVRLAYRLGRGSELQLPVPPRGMLYRGVANIAPGELDQAFSQVQREEAGQALLSFAAHCDFWGAYLRETFATRFAPLREAYEAAVLGAMEGPADDSPEQMAARIGALEEKFRQDEQALLEHLTLEQSHSII